MKFKLLKNEHGAVITHVALALSGIEREDAAQLIVSPQMALILKDKMSVKEIMTAISSMVMVVGNLAHRLVEMCEPQCETCDYDCVSELLNSAVDSACIQCASAVSRSYTALCSLSCAHRQCRSLSVCSLRSYLNC